jgi:hypothetical protein
MRRATPKRRDLRRWPHDDGRLNDDPLRLAEIQSNGRYPARSFAGVRIPSPARARR